MKWTCEWFGHKFFIKNVDHYYGPFSHEFCAEISVKCSRCGISRTFYPTLTTVCAAWLRRLNNG